MPIAKATCPECGAKLSSPDGFEIGEGVECPKCDAEFKVRAPKPAAAPAKPKVVDDDDEEMKALRELRAQSLAQVDMKGRHRNAKKTVSVPLKQRWVGGQNAAAVDESHI